MVDELRLLFRLEYSKSRGFPSLQGRFLFERDPGGWYTNDYTQAAWEGFNLGYGAGLRRAETPIKDQLTKAYLRGQTEAIKDLQGLNDNDKKENKKENKKEVKKEVKKE